MYPWSSQVVVIGRGLLFTSRAAGLRISHLLVYEERKHIGALNVNSWYIATLPAEIVAQLVTTLLGLFTLLMAWNNGVYIGAPLASATCLILVMSQTNPIEPHFELHDSPYFDQYLKEKWIKDWDILAILMVQKLADQSKQCSNKHSAWCATPACMYLGVACVCVQVHEWMQHWGRVHRLIYIIIMHEGMTVGDLLLRR